VVPTRPSTEDPGAVDGGAEGPGTSAPRDGAARGRLWWRVLLSTALAAVPFAFLVLRGDVNPLEVVEGLARLPLGVYLAALSLHLFTYAMRAQRLRFLLPREARLGFRRALTVSAAHNMASYLLPAKTGEASLVIYLRMTSSMRASTSLAALLVARFLDGAMLSGALAAACLALRSSGRYPSLDWLGALSAALVGFSALCLFASVRGDLLVRFVQVALRALHLQRHRLGERLLERSNGFALALNAAGEDRLVGAALVSVPMWLSIFAFYTLLVSEISTPLPFSEVTFGASLAFLCNLLPVNGGAGMGTQELGWVTGFHEVLGIDYGEALSTGLGVHLVQLANIVGMGVVAHLALGIAPRIGLEPRTDEDAIGASVAPSRDADDVDSRARE